MLRLFRPSPDETTAEAVETSLVELAPLVRGWVFRYVGPTVDLEDFIQEAMIELYRSLDGFRGESSLKTYARRVVMRTVADHMRRHRRRTRPLVPVPELAAVGDPERAAVSRADVRRLYDALAQISDVRRNAIVLCDLEGLSHQEAAEIEGVKLDALRARLKLGRADLRARLREESR
ncbi:MAG: RNA polymerase sigma factor [Sandaracinaceae bacterium]